MVEEKERRSWEKHNKQRKEGEWKYWRNA